MKIALLTSSRADFGIYLPLIKAMQSDGNFVIDIIAFGMHLSRHHGYTINDISAQGLKVKHTYNTLPASDTPAGIAQSMANTSKIFITFWQRYAKNYDYIICLGDRYEMYAAVSASIPFQPHIIHIHGGENTSGAIDNVFRHCISLCSTIHFTSLPEYSLRVANIVGSKKNIYTVGALSLDNLKLFTPYSAEMMRDKYGIDVNVPYILFTYHPETMDYHHTKKHLNEVLAGIAQSPYHIVITAPNNDTQGNYFYKKQKQFATNNSRATWVTNFGTQGYFSAMKYCKAVVGNSSSGIIEAASFKKYVINIGDRQHGRIGGDNIIHCKANKEEIARVLNTIATYKKVTKQNIYGNGHASEKIITILKKKHGN